MILHSVVNDSLSAAASCLLVNRHWFDVMAVLLWREVRFEDCDGVFAWAKGNKKTRRKQQQQEQLGSAVEDPAPYARMMLYTTSVYSVHITEVVEPGESVDVVSSVSH